MSFQAKKDKGFTLIEVMLALAIFAIAGTALMKATGAGLSSISYLEQSTLANWVASNRLVEVSLETTWPPRNNKKGKMELAGTEWHWRQVVQETTSSKLRAVTIEVSLTDKLENVVASQTTYVHQPVKKVTQ